MELPYLFGRENLMKALTFPYETLAVPLIAPVASRAKKASELAFGRWFRGLWTSFATNGDPNSAKQPNLWPKYGENRQVLEINEKPVVSEGIHPLLVNYVDSITRHLYVRGSVCIGACR